ncbi:hypothetical protein ERJ75_000757900 [Trypanosoma vivax]|uniref:Uncharacterized protein n=1 Tax=Trypanosoma vivax (strain Y486) TaxID=1055687 RepID=G0TV46_TRYVY|nr:hypothetical protein TRVL_06130 [Trypanosoma vivax]KAH8614055.1 hypothetical protein ERJ75_000757900 [Trypanosoma vivax]CCC47812.1 conserved hypothetical protein [Trypanosoma vivax Y486]
MTGNEPEASDYTPQELLTAIVMEHKKLEAANQSNMDRMYGALTSPFKPGDKPCEVLRVDTVRCFEEMIGKTRVGGTLIQSGGSDKTVSSMNRQIGYSGGSASREDGIFPIRRDFPPVHHCYDSVLRYETCVLEKTLSQHNSMLASFEVRRLRGLALSSEKDSGMA